MKSPLLCTLLAFSLGVSTLSFAQGNSRHDRTDDAAQYRQRGDNRDHAKNQRQDDASRHWVMAPRDERFRDGRHNDRHYLYDARGPEFRRGGHLPRDYRNHQYVINDYRSYRLSPPPRGHEWVQVGPDFVLVAIATGIIANIILNH